MFTRAIVRPPAQNFSEGLTTAALGKPDYERALRQHEAYCAALEKCGLTLTKLEADERYPDSCFVEDTAVCIDALPSDHPKRGARLGTPVGRAAAPEDAAVIVVKVESPKIPNAKSATADAKLAMHAFSPLRTSAKSSAPFAFNQMGSCVVLTRPGARSRQGEVASMRKALNSLSPTETIEEIHAPGTVDGGDVCDAGNHFFIGLSQRTNEAGAQQLAELLGKFGYTSSVMDIRDVCGVLHLKSGVAYLGNNRLVVTEAMADREEFAGYDLIHVLAGEEYAANCVRVNDQMLVAAGYPAFEGGLRELGYQTIALEMSEFQKMDGGLSCLSLRI